MAKHMASLVKLRILATHIAIVYRNDDWGTPYKNVLAPLLGKFLRSSVIESFGYDLESLSTVVTSVETFIAHKQRPCVIFLGFEEIGNYLDLVKDNATFRRATHFGVGDISFNTEMLTTYFEFLQHVQFEYLYYYGDKSGTDKRYDIIKNFSGNKTLRGGNFSMYTYPYYDAIKCINELCTGSTKATKFKSKLKDYYGVTGYIELENSRRVRGLSKSARYVSNEKEETVMSSVGILDLMEVSGYDTVKANNKYETYEVHFTSEVSFPVSITVLSGCDFIESYTINNVDEYMTLSAMDDITVSYGNSVYVVSSAVGTNTYRSLNGVRVVEGHEEQFINCMVPTNFTLVFSNEKIIGTSYYGGDGAGPSDLDGILA
jgi:hypothetical protein